MVKWFTLHGRVSRKQYLASVTAIACLTFGWFYVGGLMSSNADVGIRTTGMMLFTLTAVAGTVANLFLVVRRLHDLGKPGSHCWLLLVPFYNVYLQLVLLFAKGVAGQNQYGPDPVIA
jgi:uncharacterized membrane protein YhaH (DUF805 family)